MHIFQDLDFKKFSFRFSDISKIVFDREEKTLKLYIDFVYWNLEPKKILRNGIVLFSNWESITNDYYDNGDYSDSGIWTPCQNSMSVQRQTHLWLLGSDEEVIVIEYFAKDNPDLLRWRITKPSCHGVFEKSELVP